MVPIPYLAAKVIEVLRASPNQRRIGTSLAEVLTKQGFDSAVHGKLREFIDANVPDVERVGRAGMDWVYAIKGAPAPAGVEPEIVQTYRPEYSHRELDTAVWKTFASPNTYFRLLSNRETGELRVLHPSSAQPPEGQWLHIPPATVQQHVEIAAAWVRTLADPKVKSFLETTLREGSGPDSLFYETVKKFDFAAQWNRFRSQRLIGLLESFLATNKIPRFAPPGQQQSSVAQPASLASPTHKLRPTNKAREIALAAVQKMSDSELRNINVPLGYILDILEIR